MSNYKIKKLQIDKANELGVKIRPSTNKNKKVDVYIRDKKIYSIGGAGYNDYATYIKDKNVSKEDAEKRRISYIARHSKEPKIDKDGEFTKSLYADEILWGKRKDNINSSEIRKKKTAIGNVVKRIEAKEKSRDKKLKQDKKSKPTDKKKKKK